MQELTINQNRKLRGHHVARNFYGSGGSDLHLYHGTVQGMEPGQTLGHEFMGVEEETDSDVREVKKVTE